MVTREGYNRLGRDRETVEVQTLGTLSIYLHFISICVDQNLTEHSHYAGLVERSSIQSEIIKTLPNIFKMLTNKIHTINSFLQNLSKTRSVETRTIASDEIDTLPFFLATSIDVWGK